MFSNIVVGLPWEGVQTRARSGKRKKQLGWPVAVGMGKDWGCKKLYARNTGKT